MSKRTWPSFSGKRLRKIRKSNRYSQIQLAHEIDLFVGAQMILRYEHDLAVPSLDTAMRIAKVLEIPVEDLTDAES